MYASSVVRIFLVVLALLHASAMELKNPFTHGTRRMPVVSELKNPFARTAAPELKNPFRAAR